MHHTATMYPAPTNVQVATMYHVVAVYKHIYNILNGFDELPSPTRIQQTLKQHGFELYMSA